MQLIAGLVRSIDAANEWMGRIVAWMTLGAVLVCFLVVVLRYAFSIGYPWMQELYVWQHACVFMLGAGYTMVHRGHVGVDILYNRWPPRTQAWVDIICVLIFMFPWLAVLAFASSHFITASWAIREASEQVEGMPALYLLKSVIWVFCALLFLQGLALIGRRTLFLNDRALEPAAAGETGL